MKKFKSFSKILISGVFLGFLSCNILPIKGNGNLVSSERNVSPFEKVSSGGNANVRFYASQEYRVVVTADSNLIEIVTTNVSNNTLRIGIKNGYYSFTRVLVDVYCPVLSGVSISGSGNFVANDKIVASSFGSSVSGSGNVNGSIECDNYFVDVSGSGKISADIICNSLSAVISGSGDITIIGTGYNSNIKISGFGNFDGIEFKTNNVTARISGSGDLNIWAVENIDATVSGSGSIKYRGTPKIDFDGSGSGKIRSE